MSTIFFTKSSLHTRESREALQHLLRSGARIGVLVNGNNQSEFLKKRFVDTGLTGVVDRDLVIYTDRFTDKVLAQAAAKARKDSGKAIFVGEHREDRSVALAVGFEAAIPHVSLVPEVLNGGTLVYVRVSDLYDGYRDGRMERLLSLPAVPVHVTCEGNGSAYLITSTRIAKEIREIGFKIKSLEKHDPQVTDLYLVRDDRTVPEGMDRVEYSLKFLAEQGKADFVVEPVGNALMVALPANVSIEEIHFPKPLHGHNWRLSPDRALLQFVEFQRRGDPGEVSQRESVLTSMNGGLTTEEREALRNCITANRIEQLHRPYVGHAPLTVGGTTHVIHSRHTADPQNVVVTAALQEQLRGIGGDLLIVKPHEFYVGGGATLINVQADLPGTKPEEVVVISAHLDSIAVDLAVGHFSPAPGADDDASGMAGVLAAAEVAVKLRREVGPFKRTLRFLFFNAEEHNVHGSDRYLADNSPIGVVGVFQMDMIGFHGGKPTVFELHAGYECSSSVQENSLRLAERVRDVAAVVSPSLINNDSPQIYPRPGEFDPAEGRSDHTRFHQRGHPACMISEDHFTDLGDPNPDPQYNPDYHKRTDCRVDFSYVAEIARAVVGAAIVTAKS